VSEASRLATSSPVPRVDARARCAAASPPERRSQELSGRRLQSGSGAEPRIAAIDRGIEQFRQRRPDRLHVGPMRLRFRVLPGFLECRDFFAMPGIWDESG